MKTLTEIATEMKRAEERLFETKLRLLDKKEMLVNAIVKNECESIEILENWIESLENECMDWRLKFWALSNEADNLI